MESRNTIDKQQFRITVIMAVIVLITVIGYTYYFTNWKTNLEADITKLQTRQDHIAERHTELRTRVTTLESEHTKTSIELAKIQTQLNNIEFLLLELKKDLSYFHR